MAFENTTQRPWSLYDDGDTTGRIEIVAIGKTVARIYQTAGQSEEDFSNAELIVTAVNAHDALKDALQAIVDWANFAQQHPEEFDAHGVKNLQGPVFDKAEAALKLARAET